VLRSKEWEVFLVLSFVKSEDSKKKNILHPEDGHIVGQDMQEFIVFIN